MREHVLDLLQRYLPGSLRPGSGGNVLMKCPFHKEGQERRPSFSVNVELGLFHCLAAETKVLTPDGLVEIKKLAGKEVEVLIPSRQLKNLHGRVWSGSWKKVKIRSFGYQDLWEITLTRNGRTKVIRATEKHRWFVQMGEKLAQREVITSKLRPGHRLSTLFPERQSTRKTEISSFGVAHGFTFGDGSSSQELGQSGRVTFWGEKDRALKDYFPLSKFLFRVTPTGVRGLQVLGLPHFFKRLPSLDEAPPYILGFLAGYFAADGCVDANGHARFASANLEALEKIRTLCTKVGIATFGIYQQERLGYRKAPSKIYSLPIVASSVTSDFFILKHHRKRFEQKTRAYERLGWYVQSVSPNTIKEEVYCAEVPEEHAFVLEDNILTGNCFTCHVAGDVRYLLRLLGLSRHEIDHELAVIQPQLDENRRKQEFEKQNFFSLTDPFQAKRTLPEALLGVYDWCPTSLLEVGFSIDLLRDYEIGFDRIQQRVTYPLRDIYGNLAGIVGGKTLPNQIPKYLVYEGGHRNEKQQWVHGHFGPWFDEQFPGYRCENHNFIWNYHRVYPKTLEIMSEQDDKVFVVEGFKACLWMIQNGFSNTMALMGSYISETQQRMLHRLGSKVYLFFDNDKAGREATNRIGRLLWRPLHGRLKVVLYPPEDVQASFNGESDSQPDDYEAQGVHQMVANSLDFHVYTNQQRPTCQ